MPYDAAVTAIAVATNDALPDHVWRHDTADDGDPVADIAVALCRAAHDLITTSGLLTRILSSVHEQYGRHLETLTGYATVGPHSLDVDALRLLQQLERFDTQRGTPRGDGTGPSTATDTCGICWYSPTTPAKAWSP
jgi:hypothetical protein